MVPEGARYKLTQMLGIAREEIEGGVEVIAYGIPTIKLGKAVVHFAGYKTHMGFYPTPDVIAEFDEQLRSYKRAKGSVQFPLDEPLPEGLIRKMIRRRLKAME